MGRADGTDGLAPAGGSGAPSPVKRALAEIRELRRRLASAEADRSAPIAVIGMGCRFPGGADGPDNFWRLLEDGVDAVTEVPADRWPVDAWYDPDPAVPGRTATRWGGFVEGVSDFDAEAFGISPREAGMMDPQQRLLLEVAWESLEHAGRAPDSLVGSATGVFVGISSMDHAHLVLGGPPESHDAFMPQGIAHSAASGRLAYVLGLQGPALSVDTACSSSLVAVHLAVQSLRRGESDMALAGGVNVILQPHLTVGMSRAQMMAPDGRCKAFDARADGFVRSEGCGVVVLKRLDDALSDGDRVWAVIRGSASNQDGRSSGMAAPNGPAQEAVIRTALADAGVEPGEVGYVEAHGTGTALGDPIEVLALGAVLGRGRTAANRTRIGSAKTNLGHMEAAAGVAGLMKAVLALHHGRIPPHLHLTRPSPHVPWEELGLEVRAEGGPFHATAGRRIAGVSSFGFTGTNVHVVLESAPPGSGEAETIPARTHRLLKLSARSEPALLELAGRYAAYLPEAGQPFADQCRTAAVGRADLPHRIAVVTADADETARVLRFPTGDGKLPGFFRGVRSEGDPPEVAFLFAGHGSQYLGMGRGLFETEPAFRAALQECDRILRDLARPILPALYPAEEVAGGPGDGCTLDNMAFGQPALFAVEYALGVLWRSWGVEPAMVLGHSVGEYAAACLAGVLDLEDALRLVAARGELLDSLPADGAMAAVFAGAADVEAIIEPLREEVSIAALNGPTEVVISGSVPGVEEAIREAAKRKWDFRRLRVSRAAHSPLLDPILDEFEAVAAEVRLRPPGIEMISCTTGRLVSPDEVTRPAYWRRHLREPVRFAEAVETAAREGAEIFIEAGPQPVLCGMVGRILPEGTTLLLPSLREGEDDRREILESVARFWVRGGRIDWRAFHDGPQGGDGARPPTPVTLPNYPWRHRSFRPADPPGADPRNGLRRPARVWDGALTAGRRQEGQAPLDLDANAIPRVWEILEELSTAIMVATLRRMGAFQTAGELWTPGSLAGELGVVPSYHGLLARWLQRLAGAGLLEGDGKAFVAPAPLPAGALDRAWEAARSLPRSAAFLVEYLRRSSDLLPAVLTGRENPLETLFPEGDTATADLLYRDWALVRYFNQLLRAVVFGATGEGAGRRDLRILELGAGTGGSTSVLLPELADRTSLYEFTDVSQVFLERAKRTFQEHGFVRYGLLDINKDPVEQGYDAGTYDLVVGANVLHTADDLQRSLGYVRSLLAPGAVLVALETTEYLAWFDVTTALLEGWEAQDDGLRGDHPLLPSSGWEEALRDAGFEHTESFPGEDSIASSFGLHVLVGQNPGDGARSEVPAHGEAQPHRASMPEEGVGDGGGTPGELVDRIRSALPAERERLLTEFVRSRIQRLLRLDPTEHLDRRRRLMELGLDSLMAVELRSSLSRDLGLAEPLPATLVFDYPTIESIVGLLEGKLAGAGSPGREVEPEEGSGDGPGDESGPGSLSEEEVEARLLERLDAMEGSEP